MENPRMITIDCSGIQNKDQFHDLLAKELDFPEYYGHNLDALFDCLTDICVPTNIRLLGWNELGDWKEGFQNVFINASLENPDLDVLFA